MTRLSQSVEIINAKGLHARASAKFVTLVANLPPGIAVEVEKDGQTVTGTSIMGLMMLGAARGDRVTIHVSDAPECGPETSEKVLSKLVGLIVDGFGED